MIGTIGPWTGSMFLVLPAAVVVASRMAACASEKRGWR